MATINLQSIIQPSISPAFTAQYNGSSLGLFNTVNFSTGTTATVSNSVVTIQATGGSSSAGTLSSVGTATTVATTYYVTGITQTSTGTLYISQTNPISFDASTGILSAVTFNSTSDINQKNNVETVINAQDILDQLRGVRFTWRDNNLPSLGVIAQEVETVLPELVGETDGVKSVNYSGLTAVLIETVKNLSERVKALEAKLGEY
jgi:hypothetical protein